MSSGGTVDPDSMVEIYQAMTGEGHLPVGHIPFGEDSGGNFYLIDPSDGHVWYMPMDQWHHARAQRRIGSARAVSYRKALKRFWMH
jgi:hypothetical protein